MKIAVTQQAMIGALKMAKSIVDRKSSMAILSNVFIQTKDMDKIDILASDLEVSMKFTVGCDVLEQGACVLNGSDLYRSISACKKGIDVSIHSEKDQMTTIKSGTAKFEMYGLPESEFPNVVFTDDDYVLISKKELKRAIGDTIFCVSDDSSRPNICGICLRSAKGNGIWFESTDGHRLARTIIKQDTGKIHNLLKDGVIVPKRGAMELLKCIEQFPEDIKMSCDGRSIKLRSELFNISIKLVDAVFPETDGVIPRDFAREVVLSKVDAKDIFSRVSSMSSIKNNGVKLMLKKNKFSLEARTPDKGNAFDYMVVDYEGGDFSTCLNARYVLDVIDAIDDATNIVFRFGDDEYFAAGIFVPEESREENIYIVMPIRM